ncbi:MAG: hypothetical protein RRX93_00375 [Bacteroidales bacterium]
MKEIFAPIRFIKILTNDIVNNYKKGLLYLLVLTVLYLLALIKGRNSVDGMQIVLYIMVLFFCIVSPFDFYAHLFDKIKGVTYSMRSGSNLEKFLSAWCVSAILLPAFLFFGLWLLSVVGSLVYDSTLLLSIKDLFIGEGNFSIHIFGKANFFESTYWLILSCQSIALWGVFFFKTKKVFKTIISLCCVGIALTIIMFFLARNISMGSFVDEIVMQWGGKWEYVLDVLNITFPFIMWTWAYYKLRKQQF